MKRIMKEDDEYLKKKLLNRAKTACEEAHAILTQAAEYVRDAVGETFLFARLDSHANDLDDTIDDIKGVLNGTVDATDDTNDATDDFEHPFLESRKRFVKEAGGSKWFNEYGFLVKRIPKACIEDCSGPG